MNVFYPLVSPNNVVKLKQYVILKISISAVLFYSDLFAIRAEQNTVVTVDDWWFLNANSPITLWTKTAKIGERGVSPLPPPADTRQKNLGEVEKRWFWRRACTAIPSAHLPPDNRGEGQ